mmetsp:Transcript_68897/g.161994  ORF Transcript_68897/g.161994 Transcript_68897/m.161994 type:complete len:356 (+) Transcript_68897:71-1138(+)
MTSCYDLVTPSDSASSSGEESDDTKLPPGLNQDGFLPSYQNRAGKEGLKPTDIDCRKSIRVYVDFTPHDLKQIDDAAQEFRLVFVMHLWWLDPELRGFPSKLFCRVGGKEGSLREIPVFVWKLEEDGKLTYSIRDEKGEWQSEKAVIEKDQYVHLEPPPWGKHFFPVYTFLNRQNLDEERKPVEEKELIYCNESGGLVHYKVKCDEIFSESMELNTFPIDRQLLRVRISAEKPVEDFQFCCLSTTRRLSKHTDMWHMAKELGPCKVYVRYPDHALDYETQRSVVHAVLHVERKPGSFLHSVVMMISFVNVISLACFCIPLEHPSGRLGFLSTCFLAVLAYRYIVNDSLPKKTYMT